MSYELSDWRKMSKALLTFCLMSIQSKVFKVQGKFVSLKYDDTTIKGGVTDV